MILTSVGNLIQLQLQLISFFIKHPITLNLKPSQSFKEGLKLKLYKNTGVLILTTQAAFLASNGFWQIKILPRNTPITILASTTLFSFGFNIAVYIVMSSLYFRCNDLVAQLNLLLSYENNQSMNFNVKEVEMYQKILKSIVFILGSGFSIFGAVGVSLFNISDVKRPPFIGSILPELLLFESIHSLQEFGVAVLISLIHVLALLLQVWFSLAVCCPLMFLIFHCFAGSVFSLWVHLKEISR